jgi:HEAT repeat protein
MVDTRLPLLRHAFFGPVFFLIHTFLLSVNPGWANTSLEAQVTAYIDQLKVNDFTTQNEAMNALKALGPPGVPFLVKALKHVDRNVYSDIGRVLEAIGLPAVEELKDGLKDPDALTRAAAADTLGRIVPYGPEVRYGSEAVPNLIEALSDEDERVQHEAIEALGDTGPLAEAAVQPLVRTLKYPDVVARMMAARALGKIGWKARAAIRDLIEAMKDEVSFVREAAAEALGQMGAEATDPDTVS